MTKTTTMMNDSCKGQTGYTHDELKAAFNRVCNPSDWRAPIDCSIGCSSADVAVIMDAIVFFTATHATVTRTPSGFRFVAKGYRQGPAGC